jgi:hypothetical protein
MAAPITMITLPVIMVLFRPSMLPNQMVATAPKKQPNVYAPTVMPWTLEDWVAVHPGGGSSVLISGKYFRKEFSVNKPPRTPFDPELVKSCRYPGTRVLHTWSYPKRAKSTPAMTAMATLRDVPFRP